MSNVFFACIWSLYSEKKLFRCFSAATRISYDHQPDIACTSIIPPSLYSTPLFSSGFAMSCMP